MNKIAFALCLLMLLSIFAPNSTLNTASAQITSGPSNPELALPLIYIRNDGSVEGTDLIERNGDTYIFKADIGAVDWDEYNAYKENNHYSQGIVIQKDNITIDGAGYALTGPGHTSIYYFGPDGEGQLQPPPIYNQGSLRGIDVEGRNNVIIRNLTMQLLRSAINLFRSNNVTVLSCTLQKGAEGLNVYQSTNIIIAKSNIREFSEGIRMQNTSYCLIANNTISLTLHGILSLPSPEQSEYYADNYYNRDNVIVNNQFTNNTYAIGLGGSQSNFIVSNGITNSYVGINMAGPLANFVSDNVVSNNEIAIEINCLNSTFIRNQIINNSKGFGFYSGEISSGITVYGENNTIYSNNFIGNVNDVTSVSVSFWTTSKTNFTSTPNFWDIGGVGNFWSSYNGSDRNRDGFGDTSYSFYPVYEGVTVYCGQDNHPLMSPVKSSNGYADLPEWAQHKLVELGLIEEPTTQQTTLSTGTVVLVFAALAVAVFIGVIVYVKMRHRKVF